MARTLRHRSLHRDIDGAMEWNRLLPMLRRYYSEASRWTNQRWTNHLHKGSNKKRFQYYLDSDCFIHYMRAIQDHSVGNQVDPSLRDNVGILYIRSEYIYHVGSSLDLHSTIQPVLIERGKDTKEGRQAVFLTAVNPVTDAQEDAPHDVTNPRKVSYKTEWKVYQDAVHWTHLKNCSGERITHSGTPDPMQLSFTNLYQPTVLKKWCENPKPKRFCIRKLPYHHVHHQKLF